MFDLEESNRMARTFAKPDHVDVPHHAARLLGCDDRQVSQAARAQRLVVPGGASIGDPDVVALEQADVSQLRLNFRVCPRLGLFLLGGRRLGALVERDRLRVEQGGLRCFSGRASPSIRRKIEWDGLARLPQHFEQARSILIRDTVERTLKVCALLLQSS
jgi:hypothetical protein